jgi:hypothetical protein
MSRRTISSFRVYLCSNVLRCLRPDYHLRVVRHIHTPITAWATPPTSRRPAATTAVLHPPLALPISPRTDITRRHGWVTFVLPYSFWRDQFLSDCRGRGRRCWPSLRGPAPSLSRLVERVVKIAKWWWWWRWWHRRSRSARRGNRLASSPSSHTSYSHRAGKPLGRTAPRRWYITRPWDSSDNRRRRYSRMATHARF